jgi:hypothetical protein
VVLLQFELAISPDEQPRAVDQMGLEMLKFFSSQHQRTDLSADVALGFFFRRPSK